jgi:hypothetical protein
VIISQDLQIDPGTFFHLGMSDQVPRLSRKTCEYGPLAFSIGLYGREMRKNCCFILGRFQLATDCVSTLMRSWSSHEQPSGLVNVHDPLDEPSMAAITCSQRSSSRLTVASRHELSRIRILEKFPAANPKFWLAESKIFRCM